MQYDSTKWCLKLAPLCGPQEPREERPVHQQYPAGQVSAPTASTLTLPRASQGQTQPANTQHLREYNKHHDKGTDHFRLGLGDMAKIFYPDIGHLICLTMYNTMLHVFW